MRVAALCSCLVLAHSFGCWAVATEPAQSGLLGTTTQDQPEGRKLQAAGMSPSPRLRYGGRNSPHICVSAVGSRRFAGSSQLGLRMQYRFVSSSFAATCSRAGRRVPPVLKGHFCCLGLVYARSDTAGVPVTVIPLPCPPELTADWN